MGAGSNSGSTSNGVHQEWWKLIWSLYVSNKIKMLVWRACVRVVRCGRVLLSQKIKESQTYDICEVDVEFEFHAFWFCFQAKSLWKKLDFILFPRVCNFLLL